jgi:hypothetical protein
MPQGEQCVIARIEGGDDNTHGQTNAITAAKDAVQNANYYASNAEYECQQWYPEMASVHQRVNKAFDSLSSASAVDEAMERDPLVQAAAAELDAALTEFPW